MLTRKQWGVLFGTALVCGAIRVVAIGTPYWVTDFSVEPTMYPDPMWKRILLWFFQILEVSFPYTIAGVVIHRTFSQRMIPWGSILVVPLIVFLLPTLTLFRMQPYLDDIGHITSILVSGMVCTLATSYLMDWPILSRQRKILNVLLWLSTFPLSAWVLGEALWGLLPIGMQ